VHLIQPSLNRLLLERREAGELKHLAVDEMSFLKGHRYATVLSDLDHPRVLDVARERKEESPGGATEPHPPTAAGSH
jgi:transposase